MLVTFFLATLIGLFELISTRYDPSECIGLMKRSRQWDGAVSIAIQDKAGEALNKGIRTASWGLLDKPRGGECDLNFKDVQLILAIGLVLWVIKKIQSRNKCASLWRSCRKTRSQSRTKTPPPSPREKPLEKPPPTKPNSKVRYRKAQTAKHTKHRSQTQLHLVHTEIQKPLTPKHGNIVQTV
jgi:hypothetical protein